MSCATISSRVKRSRATRSTIGARSASATSARSGWRRCSSSVRYVATSSTRWWRALRTKKARKSRDERSAQWTSSKTSTSGCACGQASQEGEQELEHAPLRERALGAGIGRVELGQQRRQAGRGAAELAGVEAAQRADDRRIGQLAVAEVDAVAGEHARALRPRAGRELGDQPRLADARLARDQGDRRAPVGRALERRGQARELALAPDELGARDPLRQVNRPRPTGASLRRLGSGLDAPSPPRPRARFQREPRARGSTPSRARSRCTWSSRSRRPGASGSTPT